MNLVDESELFYQVTFSKYIVAIFAKNSQKNHKSLDEWPKQLTPHTVQRVIELYFNVSRKIFSTAAFDNE